MGSDEGDTDYEAIRKQRLEENKRRMQELGISELSQSLSKAGPKPNSKPAKQRFQNDDFPIEVRRSSRAMDGPRPNYSDAVYSFSLPRKSGPRIAGLPMRYASDVERIKAAERANKLQEELQNGNPSFVKMMLVSHVSGGFWLGLPNHFCKKNLPLDDGVVVLEDEKGGKWDSIYLAHRTGLSGGWRGFAMDHSLEDGDAIVFELTEPRRLKVHIVRCSEVGGEIDDKENVDSSKGDFKRKAGGKKNAKAGSGKKLAKKGKRSPKEVGGLESHKKAKTASQSPLRRSANVDKIEQKSKDMKKSKQQVVK